MWNHVAMEVMQGHMETEDVKVQNKINFSSLLKLFIFVYSLKICSLFVIVYVCGVFFL